MIVFVYPQLYGVGGIARYLDLLFANLPASERAVVITGTAGPVPRRYAAVRVVHVPVPANRFGLLLWGLAVRRELDRLAREEGPLTVNFHWPPLIPGLLLPSRHALVLTAHTTYRGMSGAHYGRRYFVSQWGRASIAVKMAMERIVLRRARKVIALTAQGEAEVRAYGFRGPVAVIPNGADLERFVPSPQTFKDIDVLFSGRIEQRKGSRSIPEVCRRLVAARPSIRIMIVGYGEDDAWLATELAGCSANVTLTGKVGFDEMIGYYARARVYASTSHYEGLPGTCLEAFAMELPAVVWRHQFYEGLVREGVDGHLVEPNDGAAMALRIVGLLDEPERARALGVEGRRILASGYDWKKLAVQIAGQLRAPG